MALWWSETYLFVPLLVAPTGLLSTVVASDQRSHPLHNETASLARIPNPRDEVWRLRKGDRLVTCVLMSGKRRGAGWDVQLFEGGKPHSSRRCARSRGARFVAEAYRRALIRA